MIEWAGEQHPEEVPAEVYEAAISLSPGSRAALVDMLLDSLEQTFAPAAKSAWVTEVERRIAELDQGLMTSQPAEGVLRRIEARRAR